MKNTALRLYPVPKDFWQPGQDVAADIGPFVKDALAIERRIRKEVNLVNERKRYQLCCRRIQDAVLGMVPEQPNVLLGPEYFDVLRVLLDRFPAETVQARTAACFFPPEEIATHMKSFQQLTARARLKDHPSVKKRIEFFESVHSRGEGVVEIADFLTPVATDTSKPEISLRQATVTENVAQVLEGEDLLSKEKIRGLSNVFKSRIQKALDHGGEVNFSNQPHYVIADVLNDVVYKDGPDEPARQIRVIYMDGSEAEPFPLRCLPRLTESEPGEQSLTLKASLISMRHLEMDEKVDFAWFRNRKVSVSRPFAETDAYCTVKTVELLAEMANRELNLHLYQTGLETAVVGFYRGLVRVLEQRRRDSGLLPLRVVPYYFHAGDKGYRAGKTWS